MTFPIDPAWEDSDQPLTEAEQKLVQTMAAFLGRQMEN